MNSTTIHSHIIKYSRIVQIIHDFTDLDTLGGGGNGQVITEHQGVPGQLLCHLIPLPTLNHRGLGVWAAAHNVVNLSVSPVMNLLLEVQVVTGGRLIIGSNFVNLWSIL